MPTHNTLNERAAKIALFALHEKSFTRADCQIANYIADNMQSFMETTISELSKATSVSEITISRFCKKLNLAGLQALKIQFAASNHVFEPQLAPLRHDLCASDSPEDTAHKLFNKIREGLDDTLHLLDYEAIDRVAHNILSSNKVLCFGYGNSATVCRDYATRFSRFGLNCEAVSDLDQQLTLAAVCPKSTIIVAISYSGSSINLTKPLLTAKERGAYIVLITSHKSSPLSNIADDILLGRGPEVKLNDEASASRLLHMAIGDIIYTRMAFLAGKSYDDNIQSMRKAIAQLKA